MNREGGTLPGLSDREPGGRTDGRTGGDCGRAAIEHRAVHTRLRGFSLFDYCSWRRPVRIARARHRGETRTRERGGGAGGEPGVLRSSPRMGGGEIGVHSRPRTMGTMLILCLSDCLERTHQCVCVCVCVCVRAYHHHGRSMNRKPRLGGHRDNRVRRVGRGAGQWLGRGKRGTHVRGVL
ncbi:hypothetical protein LY76DRAFT_186933 [Colletotrichum caudatum]|nr:hypothetical protein LY76DRAFT_186933 [Colletotrichum caudatum]